MVDHVGQASLVPQRLVSLFTIIDIATCLMPSEPAAASRKLTAQAGPSTTVADGFPCDRGAGQSRAGPVPGRKLRLRPAGEGPSMIKKQLPVTKQR